MKPLIDVSYWQDPANINYQELAKHISGVIIRVGYTTTGTHTQKIDPHFETHYAKFKEYGVPVGAYYYSCATNLSVAEAEAEATIAFLKGKRFEYPIWYDMEEDQQRALPKSLLTDIAISYCEKLEGAGYYVGLYSWDSWFWEEMEPDRLDPFDIWAARTAGEPRIRHGIWQYSHTGRLPGYNSNIDLNRAYKDHPKIIKDAGLNGYSKPSSTYPVNSIYINGSASIQGYSEPDWKGQYGPIKRPHIIIHAVERADIGENSFVRDQINDTWYWIKSGTSWKVRGGWSPELGSVMVTIT